MTRFLDVRLWPVGGPLRTDVNINQGDSYTYTGLSEAKLLSDIRGQDVLIGVHGFNVSRPDGVAHLSNWESLLHIGPSGVFVGVVWPGDSIWLQGLDYPEEPRIANEAGQLIGPFLDEKFAGAASISFVSHSLGARVVLSTIAHMQRQVRRVTLMAGAIDDNCLTAEFREIPKQIDEISVLASRKDNVLSRLFPMGNLVGGIIAAGHPWWHEALGRGGPNPPPNHFKAPFEIPDGWTYDHGDYLRDSPQLPATLPVPPDVPPPGSARPAATDGWQQIWSATVVSNRFS
jgi:Alpha/beta hydrolase of unknown function (DUF900)